jgi:hypothetical protein
VSTSRVKVKMSEAVAFAALHGVERLHVATEHAACRAHCAVRVTDLDTKTGRRPDRSDSPGQDRPRHRGQRPLDRDHHTQSRPRQRRRRHRPDPLRSSINETPRRLPHPDWPRRNLRSTPPQPLREPTSQHRPLQIIIVGMRRPAPRVEYVTRRTEQELAKQDIIGASNDSSPTRSATWSPNPPKHQPRTACNRPGNTYRTSNTERCFSVVAEASGQTLVTVPLGSPEELLHGLGAATAAGLARDHRTLVHQRRLNTVTKRRKPPTRKGWRLLLVVRYVRC